MDTMERFVGESEHPSMRRSLKYDYLFNNGDDDDDDDDDNHPDN